MKILKLFVVVMLMLFLCLSMISCYSLFQEAHNALSRSDFSFLHKTSEIHTIEIIKIEKIQKIDNDIILDIKVIFDIHDTELFLEKFSYVSCYRRYSDPISPSEGVYGIKISYNNDDYEIICSSGQSECINGIYYHERGNYSFDSEQFEKLINEYIDSIENDTVS